MRRVIPTWPGYRLCRHTRDCALGRYVFENHGASSNFCKLLKRNCDEPRCMGIQPKPYQAREEHYYDDRSIQFGKVSLPRCLWRFATIRSCEAHQRFCRFRSNEDFLVGEPEKRCLAEPNARLRIRCDCNQHLSALHTIQFVFQPKLE